MKVYNLCNLIEHTYTALIIHIMLTYLISCLSGIALSLENCLSMTEAKLVVTIQALIDRYRFNRLIITSIDNKFLF